MGRISEFQRVDVEKLIPYVNNAKKHSDGQITRIAASIREFGFLSPVVIDNDYNVIAGHGRIMAAKKLGMTDVPCVFADGLTDAQRKAYILADNRLSEFAEWDMELVTSELEALQELDFDIDLTGFELPDEGGDGDGGSAETSFNYEEQYGVIVMCKNESEQESVYNELTASGYECKVVSV